MENPIVTLEEACTQIPAQPKKGKRHAHNWQFLFTRPNETNTPGLRFEFILRLRWRQDIVVCECGAVGSISNGYAAGGGRKIHRVDAETAAKYREVAKEWGERVEADRAEKATAK